WTMRVLREAQRMHERTGGVFDPTVARMLVAHKILPRPAGPTAEVDARIADVVTLGENRIGKRRPLWLDLGGIAKGFAVDMAVRVYGTTASAVVPFRLEGICASLAHMRSPSTYAVPTRRLGWNYSVCSPTGPRPPAVTISQKASDCLPVLSPFDRNKY
ncbi:hypothetical protein P3T32_005234, partial [Ralstonia sp. GP73]|nr:hypothetical protein [Ralstonia sp. GP73]